MSPEKNLKDTEKTQAISLPNVRSNPFGSNISAEKAYRRAERIAAALYMLTKYMPEQEPLRGAARLAGQGLLKDILELRAGFRSGTDAADTLRLHAHVREAISLSQLLAVAGYVSKENADMVTKALEELSQFVETSGTTQLAERITFTKEDLLIDGHMRREVRMVRGAESVASESQQTQKSNKGQEIIKDGMSSRRAAILDVLRDGKKMGIRDIASFVVGCSEKTVQRELSALVSDGIIKKEGEKRWSKYFIPR